MRLLDTRVTNSPYYDDFRRLEGRIEIESRNHVLNYAFDFPADLEGDLSEDIDGWALLMLPLAVYFNEPLRLTRPIDGLMLENLHGLQRLWAFWYPELHVVEIEAPQVHAHRAPDPKGKTIVCFSGGVDSLFTFFRHNTQVRGNGHGVIDELLCIAGLMTSIEDIGALRREFEAAAARFGKRLIPIVADFRYRDHGLKTPYSVAFGEWWENMAHGPAIAAPVHFFAPRYKELLIPSSFDLSDFMPWGSHMMTDPLFASSHLGVTHDGAVWNRTERIAFVGEHEGALDLLHVCGQDRQDGNCSVCEKCLRTMAMIDLLGLRDKAPTFDWSKFTMERLSHVWFGEKAVAAANKESCFREIAREARTRGRRDIADAAMRAIAYSRRKRRVLALIRSNPLTAGAWALARRWRPPQALTAKDIAGKPLHGGT